MYIPPVGIILNLMRRNITNTGTFKAGFSIRLQHLHFPKKVVGIGIVVRLKMPPYAKNMCNCLIFMSFAIFLSCLNRQNCFLSLKSKCERKIVFDD
jgi:hypothetical protein